jgi:hypothetical protein
VKHVVELLSNDMEACNSGKTDSLWQTVEGMTVMDTWRLRGTTISWLKLIIDDDLKECKFGCDLCFSTGMCPPPL